MYEIRQQVCKYKLMKMIFWWMSGFHFYRGTNTDLFKDSRGVFSKMILCDLRSLFSRRQRFLLFPLALPFHCRAPLSFVLIWISNFERGFEIFPVCQYWYKCKYKFKYNMHLSEHWHCFSLVFPLPFLLLLQLPLLPEKPKSLLGIPPSNHLCSCSQFTPSPNK